MCVCVFVYMCRQHCKLWVISVTCSGASIFSSVVSAAISTWPQNFLLFIRTDDMVPLLRPHIINSQNG